MTIHVMARTYNSYGGHPALSFGGHFLLVGAPDFGKAIQTIDITFHLPPHGRARKSLEDMLERYREFHKTLPKITFRKARGAVDIQVASELMDGEDWDLRREANLEVFNGSVHELVGALGMLRMRLKAKDDFKLEDFLAHCQGRLLHLPTNQGELEHLLDQLKAADKARREAMSPWEKLDIDWKDYHSTARDLLNEPFYWECTDDFAPHGNDTGADVLELYRTWRKKHGDDTPLAFLESLARSWGYGDLALMEEHTRREAMVAVAFAQIKLSGTCHAEARKLAEAAITEQRSAALTATDWPHREERLTSLEKLLAVLGRVR